METILKLIESYGIARSKVASHELLEGLDFEKCESIMEYLNEKGLLKSKFIINKLATILSTRKVSDLEWLEETLFSYDLNAYEIMFKANSLLFCDNKEKILGVINELQKEEYDLDYKKILTNASAIIVSTSPGQIRKVVQTLKFHGLDHRKICLKSAEILSKGSLNNTDEIIRIIYEYFGKEEGMALFYKSVSLLNKAIPTEVENTLIFFESKIGKQATKDFFTKNASILAKCKYANVKHMYEELEKIGLVELIFSSPSILLHGNVKDIKTNYTWLKEQNPNIDIISAPMTLTYPHETIKNNYEFYRSHNLDQYITNRASCLGKNKSTEELESIYNFLVSIGIEDFEEYMSVLSTTNLHEIEEIYLLLINEFGKEKALELIQIPSILLANYTSMRDSIAFIRGHNLFSELEDKPYILSETYADKMAENLTFLSTVETIDLTTNLTIITRGQPDNMKKIIEYLSSLGLENLLNDSPITLTKKYKDVKACMEYFRDMGRLDLVISTPSLLNLKVEEIKKAYENIKDFGLEDLLEKNPNILRNSKNIKDNASSLERTVFPSVSGVASVYSSAATKVNARKKFFDDNGLTFLYENAPSILSEGDIELIKESYLYLIEQDLGCLLSKAPSIITRLKGKQAIQERLAHLYSLGITKENIKELPTILIRYSDEEILKQLQLPRKHRN